MNLLNSVILILYCLLFCMKSLSCQGLTIFGPGLSPDVIVMPARYFFVNVTLVNQDNYNSKLNEQLEIDIRGKSKYSNHCRLWVNKLDLKDGTFIVRYKIFETCYDLVINILFKNKHISISPLIFPGPILPDQCDCPEHKFEDWLNTYGCPKSYEQIDKDLKKFPKFNMETNMGKIVDSYHRPESTSFCHYVIKDNEINRDCYGKHVGFNMFADNILSFLTRKVMLPDLEFVMNLGDWPLVKKGTEPLPVFSWCGSVDTMDIVVPTYDITESTLENMGRVTLDTLSVQGSISTPWSQREPRAVWRGRDSRAERLSLIDIARKHPDLFNASLTNFFFFRDKEAEYGPKQPHISFFKFFDYKYQINIDGTVAAYRLPYLLAGGGMVLKQDSPYYEHFYHSLTPWYHYVPIKRDLSDLVEKVLWAREHDDEAHTIADNARRFAQQNLLPQHIICYHAVLFWEWSKRLENKVRVREGMEKVPKSGQPCDCPHEAKSNKDEL